MKMPCIKIPLAFSFGKGQVAFFVLLVIALLLSSILQGCSNGNGFHLRNSIELPAQYQLVSLDGLPTENGFQDVFQEALEDAGGKLVEENSTANSIIRFSKFKEGKRIIAYTSDLVAREYLLSLKFNYEISNKNKATKKENKLETRRINIDKSYLYDSDFALGKAEEEKLVKNNLYQEAARLIILNLKYSK